MAKRTKKVKVDTIRGLQLVANNSLKRSREMETKNQQLERNYVWLERENHRLTLLVEIETKRMLYAPTSNTPSLVVLSATVSPDRNCSFIDHTYVVPSIMDIEPDCMLDNDDLFQFSICHGEDPYGPL